MLVVFMQGIAGGMAGLWLLNQIGALLPLFGLSEVRQPMAPRIGTMTRLRPSTRTTPQDQPAPRYWNW